MCIGIHTYVHTYVCVSSSHCIEYKVTDKLLEFLSHRISSFVVSDPLVTWFDMRTCGYMDVGECGIAGVRVGWYVREQYIVSGFRSVFQ